MDKSVFNDFPDEGLIKTTDVPSGELTPSQKVHLNRRGNELFNSGDVEKARRIFQTTGYSDGLMRVGEHLLDQGKAIEALKMFKLAHAEKRCDELTEKAAMAIRKLLGEEENK